MTRACLLGAAETDLPVDLLTYETAREALSSYDLQEPFANAMAIETISLGAAVSLLNDLQWYIVRLIEETLVLEPSVSETEWLSRNLAETIRDGEIDPADTGEYLKIYGLVHRESGPPELAEPMFARRVEGNHPTYDLRDVAETTVVRITKAEFEA
ncbi:MAG: DUF5804 family protein [Halobacteriales archaeon]